MFKRLILLCLALVLVGVLLTQSVFASSKYTTKWEKSNAPVNLPILMYHSVENKPGNGLCVPPEQLEQQLKYLHERAIIQSHQLKRIRSWCKIKYQKSIRNL